MKAYLIANVDITNPEGFGAYSAKVSPLVTKHGGKYLIRGGEVTNKEGDFDLKRLVVIEFPSADAANGFYDDPDYQPVLALRQANAVSSVVLAEGYRD